MRDTEKMPASASGNVLKSKFQTTIEALNDCVQACNACMTDDLQEDDVKMMVRCIQLDRDCADICSLTSQYLARESDFGPSLARLCAAVCDACAEECEQHPDMVHCVQCAKVCRDCAKECRKVSD